MSTFIVIISGPIINDIGQVAADEYRSIQVEADRYYETPAGSLAFETYAGPKDGWANVRAIAAGRWKDVRKV